MAIFDQNLSVRETEAFVKKVLKQLEETNKPETEKQAEKDLSVFYSELETRLKDILGAKISIKAKNNGKGKIEIDYYSQDELDRITEMLYSINR